MHIFQRDFLCRNASGTAGPRPEKSQKTTCNDQDGILMKIFNGKRWPQQEYVFCNLRNLEKVKSKLEKIRFHYIVSYF